MVGGRLVAQDGDIAEVEAAEEIVAQVAAIDVAKASGMVCTRVPHPAKPGQRATRYGRCRPPSTPSSSWPSSWPAKGSNGSWFESTSDSWRPFVYVLEARGLVVWLAERGRLRPSFVPPAQIRQLRDYTRLRSDLTGDRARHVQRLEQAAGWTP